jgi:hypothetical protein
LTTFFEGEVRAVVLDGPVSELEGIIDYKDYNWSSSCYREGGFLQGRVTSQFQQQILKYQSIDPRVTFVFSQEPLEWVIHAIEDVGGMWRVAE